MRGEVTPGAILCTWSAGYGHVARLNAICEALVEQGIPVDVYCPHTGFPGHLSKSFRRRVGFLPCNEPNWDMLVLDANDPRAMVPDLPWTRIARRMVTLKAIDTIDEPPGCSDLVVGIEPGLPLPYDVILWPIIGLTPVISESAARKELKLNGSGVKLAYADGESPDDILWLRGRMRNDALSLTRWGTNYDRVVRHDCPESVFPHAEHLSVLADYHSVHTALSLLEGFMEVIPRASAPGQEKRIRMIHEMDSNRPSAVSVLAHDIHLLMGSL